LTDVSCESKGSLYYVATYSVGEHICTRKNNELEKFIKAPYDCGLRVRSIRKMKESKPKSSEAELTRRSFLKASSTAVMAGAMLSALPEGIPFSRNETAVTAGAVTDEDWVHSRRLLSDWEYRRGGLGGPWEAWREASENNVAWQKVELPHCFNARDAVDPDGVYYQGPGWYRTRLKINNPFPSGRTLLHFEGAGQKTEVFVHTTRVGSHVGGYDEFTVDITDAASQALKKPNNKGLVPIAVRCDNSRDLEMIPSNLSDFNLYGGLYRYVNLVYVPAISIERVHVLSRIDGQGKASLTVRARLYNPDGGEVEPVELNVKILDPQGKLISSFAKKVTASNGVLALGSFNVDTPTLWSPASPALYRCGVMVSSQNGKHSVSERFGLRSYEFVKQGPFKLNGRRLLIRGTQRHEDHAGLGSAMTEELLRKEMTLIKEMGANFVRLAHYQQSRIVLDLCDELGLMVWEEVPWCRGGVGGDTYKEQARRMLRNMIDQHRNHPAVIIWGLGNENDWPGDFEEFDKDKIRAFMTELNSLAHTLDPSRKTAIRRCDFCKDIVDVYSPSIWAGWYRGRYTEYKSSSEEEMKKVDRFLHMEWGGDSHARRHSESPDQVISKIAVGQGTDERGLDYLLTGGIERASRDGDWSETYICNLFDWHLKEQETMEWLTGAAQWIFKDFSTPARPENPIPRVNQKGLVERDLTLKEGYFVFQSYWTEKPMVHIYGHSWPVRWGKSDERKLVKVYSNCSEVELFLNGNSVGRKQRKSADFPAAGLRWLVTFNEGENELKAIAHKERNEVTDQVSFVYQTQSWGKPAKLNLRKLNEAGDLVTIEARLVDQDAKLCLDARNVVRFGLIGGGRLLDNLGTSVGSRQVELYNGRAIISLQRQDAVVASVSAEGIKPAFLTIEG
jgi:beta-galactosidase